MGRPCEACRHEKRAEIDARLLSGATAATIAPEYGLSRPGLYRHQAQHLRPVVAKAARAVGALASAPGPFAKASPSIVLSQSLPTLNSLSAVAERLAAVADHMKEERERASEKGAAGIVIGAAAAERAALADLAKMIQNVQDAVTAQAQHQDERWGDLVAVVLDAIPDEGTRVAVARRLADATE